MIKIAICLSGEPREFEKTWFSWSKLRNNPELDIDFFIHTWEDTTMPGDNNDHHISISGRRNKEYYDTIFEKLNKNESFVNNFVQKLNKIEGISAEEAKLLKWIEKYNKYNNDNSEYSGNLSDLEEYTRIYNREELQTKLNRYYKPKKLWIAEKTELIQNFYENPLWVSPSKFDAYMNSNYGSVSQWYSTQQSFRMKQVYCKKVGKKYDLCIKSRLDTFCLIQTKDAIDNFITQLQNLLHNKEMGVYTSWIEIMEGEIRTEYATMIGKDQVMHKMWDDILYGISRWYHLAAENHHDLFTKYVTHQLKYTKTSLVQRSLLDNFVIVRPTVGIDKLKRLYKNKDFNKLREYVGTHYREFRNMWQTAPSNKNKKEK